MEKLYIATRPRFADEIVQTGEKRRLEKARGGAEDGEGLFGPRLINARVLLTSARQK